MTTVPASDLHSLPPPLELRDADLLVGWIDGDFVQFRGFASETGAAQAAAVAHQAMVRRLARGTGGAPAANESNLAVVRRTNDHANAPANSGRVASVLRSVVDGIRGADSGDFAFEIRVPPPVDELRMRGMAYVMYRALRSSGVAWPLWSHAVAPEALTAMATRTVDGPNESTSDSASRGFPALQRLLARASRTWAFPRTRPQRAG